MTPTPTDYRQLLTDIKQRVRAAQYRALQQVNQQQIQLYWDLGQLIAERQQQHGWGKSIVETLARDLQTEFVDMSGFSILPCATVRCWGNEFLAQLVREILQLVVGETTDKKYCNQWLQYFSHQWCE